MFNVKDRNFNFQIYDYLTIGGSHFLLSRDDIKILDTNLDFICRIPLQISEQYEKFAMSADWILLMKNDFTLIGGGEWPEMHAPVMKLLLLNHKGEILSSHIVENAYGLAIGLSDKCLSFIYSGFNDKDGKSGEAETRFITVDEHFYIKREHVLYRDSCIMEFPVCEAVFDSYGRGILFNTEGEFYVWDVTGDLHPLVMDQEDRLGLIQDFHKIRNLQFLSNDSEIVLSFSTGRFLRYSFCPIIGKLKLNMESSTGSENSHQFVLKGPRGDMVISSRWGETILYKRTNSVRFIAFD